ncbi:MAG: HEAT repeat domain-containing protein [Planctomycetota bacterium]
MKNTVFTGFGRVLLAGAVALSWLGWTGVASAQPDDIDQEIKVANVINAEQEAVITGVVDQEMDLLIGGDAEQIAGARQRLLRQFRTPGASQAFLQAMSRAVVKRMPEAVESPKVMVRLNAVIVLGEVDPGVAGVFPLVQQALQDTSSAVRYWAAKSLTRLSQGSLGRIEELEIIGIVQPMIELEQSMPVLQFLYRALANLDADEAIAALLESLNTKVAFHVARPNQPHMATEVGLRRVYRQITLGEVQKLGDKRRQMVRAAYRCFELIADQMVQGKVDDAQRAGHGRVLVLAHTAMRRAYQDGGGQAAKIPGGLQNAVNFRNWQRVQQVGEQWKRLLAEPAPFGFQAQELLPAGAGANAAQ